MESPVTPVLERVTDHFAECGVAGSTRMTAAARWSAVEPSASLRWRIESTPTALDHIAEVWSKSGARNPFVSPAFVRVMREATPAETRVFALGSDRTGAPVAAWPLRVSGARTLRFLTLEYSDQSTCIAREGTDEAELGNGLAFAIQSTAARRLELKNIPLWGPTLGAVRHAVTRAGWCMRAFPAWPCPVLRVLPGADAGVALRQSIEQHKRLRGYANALRREPGYEFEALEGASDLDGWCADFCATHQERWNGTDTPSPYAKAGAAEVLSEVLGAWAADGVLARFAIRIDGRRVALAACLRSGTRLIYYHVVVSPAAERSRAGHVLIRLIGLWMSERNFDSLDFGAGGEEYKYRYANADERLWRVFAAASPFSTTFVRGVVEERIRRSPKLQRRWDQAMGGRLGGEARRQLSVALAVLSHVATAGRSAID